MLKIAVPFAALRLVHLEYALLAFYTFVFHERPRSHKGIEIHGYLTRLKVLYQKSQKINSIGGNNEEVLNLTGAVDRFGLQYQQQMEFIHAVTNSGDIP